MKNFVLIVKILVPVAFFAIANITNLVVANAIAGVLTIAVVYSYVVENKEK